MGTIVDFGAVVVTTADGAASMLANPSSVNILSSTGQVIAAAVSLSPAGTIAIAPGAAVVTGLKIVADVQGGNTISGGDILSIAGNIVGVIGAVGAVTVGGSVIVAAAGIGLGLAIAGAALNSTDSGAWPGLIEDARRALFPGYARDLVLIDAVDSWFLGGSRTRPPAPRDPLAIDLDGDGIETVGSATNPVLFDHNADGIRAGTGWVRPNDAWLVLERNGNGLIDSGRELFGVDTVLSGTPGVNAVYATTGFQALRTLDTGSGVAGSAGYADNVFNASDAAFTQVRLWRDLNQDGVSQAGELFTLAQQNIASISLNASTTTINLGNGNVVSGTSTVTRTNGSTTLAETVGVAFSAATARDAANCGWWRSVA